MKKEEEKVPVQVHMVQTDSSIFKEEVDIAPSGSVLKRNTLKVTGNNLKECQEYFSKNWEE